MNITDQRQRWVALAKAGLLDEFATVGVREEERRSGKLVELVRAIYRHSRYNARNPVLFTGTILEPAVVSHLENTYHFIFTPVGPPQHYMEGTKWKEDVITQPFVSNWAAIEKRFADPNTGCLEFLNWLQKAPMDVHWEGPVILRGTPEQHQHRRPHTREPILERPLPAPDLNQAAC